LNRLQLVPLLVLLLVIPSGLSAQDEDAIDIYGLGDQTFSINAGPLLPLFIHGVDRGFVSGFSKLSLGAAGSLKWAAYLNNDLTVGLDLGGMFAFTLLNRTLVMLPVTGMVTYAFQFYPFEAHIHAGVGVNFTKLDNDLYVGPIIKPGASIYWNFNGEWSFGLQTEYWWVPEIYFGTSPPSSQTNFANFLGITLTTLYHFQ
jgi:hypothetical protein